MKRVLQSRGFTEAEGERAVRRERWCVASAASARANSRHCGVCCGKFEATPHADSNFLLKPVFRGLWHT
jgi:hypothetical protein